MQTRSLHLPSTSTLQIWDLCFQMFLSWHQGPKGPWRGDENVPCFLLVLRFKVQPRSLIHTPPTHVEDWAVGSPSESFKRSCKALTIGNKMWFLFSCDQEAGRCAQWRVVLINLQHFEL